jgi:hypothetical protein
MLSCVIGNLYAKIEWIRVAIVSVVLTALGTSSNRSLPLAGGIESSLILRSTVFVLVGPATGREGGRGQGRNREAASFEGEWYA